jgi:hypothetical protein
MKLKAQPNISKEKMKLKAHRQQIFADVPSSIQGQQITCYTGEKAKEKMG